MLIFPVGQIAVVPYPPYLVDRGDEGFVFAVVLDDILDFLEKNPESSFETYLENASLQTSQDEIKNGDYVSMMTIHVAEGLEFDHVFVVSMIDGVFPSRRTEDESGAAVAGYLGAAAV